MRERVKWVRPINLNDTFRPIVNIAALEKQKSKLKHVEAKSILR